MVDAQELETVVDALYALPPTEFIGRRNELAKALRSEKRQDDAARVATLAKPTAAAWALNQIARRRPDLVDALRSKGAQLRQVQDRVLGGQAEVPLLVSASDERRQAIRDVVGAMSEALETGAVRRTDEWVRTLEAASVDDRLGELLRIGRFTTVVLEGVGFDGLLAGNDPVPRHLSVVPPLPDPVAVVVDPVAVVVDPVAVVEEAARVEAAQIRAAAAEAARVEAARVAAEDRAAGIEHAARLEADAMARVMEGRLTETAALEACARLERSIIEAESALAQLRQDLASSRQSKAAAAQMLRDAQLALGAAKAERRDAELG